MSIQTIMWTALPNGLSVAGDRLQLSVLVSPRLVTDNGTDGTLAQFKSFLDWPAVVTGLRFSVQFQGGPTFEAQPVTEPPYPAPDSAAWTALFHNDTFVRSYEFDDRIGRAVRSFPTKQVLSFVRDQYTFFAVNSPSEKPNVETLGWDPEGAGGAQLGFIVLSPDVTHDLDGRLAALLTEYGAVPPEPPGQSFPALDFYQVQVMHEFLSKKVEKPDGSGLEPLPPQQPTEVDFHKAVASLGQYPSLMRAMGIAIDLEVPFDQVAPAGSVRVAPSLQGAPPMTPWTAYEFRLADRVFLPAASSTSDVTDGMLALNWPDDYDVVELDVDGAARKLADFATNVSRIGQSNTSIDTPQNYGLPALRSAGFSAARAGRALRLVNTFQDAHNNNAAVIANPQNSGVVLHSDDVTRGYRVDVWSSLDGQWRSLCLRDGTYTFTDTSLTRSYSDEGFTTVATSQSADGTTTDMRLPESLFRWAGWSLCAPRAGKTIGSDSTPATPQNPATTQIHLETNFTVQKGTLPRLRFGALYQFRARAVDLTGNSIPYDAVLDDVYNLPPQPVPYLRCEPVSAPVVVLRVSLDPVGTPGESLDRIVIRSNFNTHIAGVSERHIAPPKTSQTMAEEHGMLDTPAGPPDKTLYSMLVNKDGSFNQDPSNPSQPSPQPEAQLTLPYLPDPFSPGAAFDSLPGADTVWMQSFTGTWPETLPFRLMLDEGSGPPVFTETPAERVLRVRLPKAEVAAVNMSCYLTDDDTTKPPDMLSTMQVWQWIVEQNPTNLEDLRQLALNGGHWMLTPPKTLTLVHAVQQPLIEPEFQNLTADKQPGETFASLTDAFPISGKSTIRVDIQGAWTEPVDDLSDSPQPVILDGSAQAFQVPIQATDTVAVIDNVNVVNKHEFHDTKHRNVTYTAIATTRFKEYFPDTLTAEVDNITRTSQPVTLSILNSARPLAPKPLYVVPVFGWEGQAEGVWNFSRRSTGLRVYLDRPWFSSGEGELLGAVLWQCPPPQHIGFESFEVPDFLRSYVTQWGMDPIWDAPPPPSQAVPLQEHFRNAGAFADGLTLGELSQYPFTPVAVAGHTVAYDTDRNLWYCDIEMDHGQAYFPFVRLALARYQPESIADAHLSRVVLADFAQLMPGRSASITFDGLDPTSLTLAVTGLTFTSPGSVSVAVTVQEQVPGGSGDLAWVPASCTPLNPVNASGDPDTLWTAPITLPAARGSRPMRLLIEEYENYETDQQPSAPTQNRLVYADILNL